MATGSVTFTVAGGRVLRGAVRVPGDKSISIRAVLLGALAEGTSVVTGLSDGEDVAAAMGAVTALGVELRRHGPVTGRVEITGGADRLRQPAGPLDCGNSGTAMRLLAGALAGYPLDVTLVGDESLSSRPMDRVAVPLRLMGAQVEGRGERCLPPLSVRGGRLRGIAYELPVASAQVKSAVLLAGLRAAGATVVQEAVRTRPHTEEMLGACGADIEVVAAGEGQTVTVRASHLTPFEVEIPGDPSQAAFWVVAAAIVAGSEVVVEEVHVGEGRRAFVDVLRRMGAHVEERDRRMTPTGPVADLVTSAGRLHGTVVGAHEASGLIDEVPVLAVAAAAAQGETVFRSVGELRVKESDRLAATASLVRALGAGATVDGDDLVVEGVGGLRAAPSDARGDHRMAMAAAVAGMAAAGESEVSGWEAVPTSYPGFGRDLLALGGRCTTATGGTAPVAGKAGTAHGAGDGERARS